MPSGMMMWAWWRSRSTAAVALGQFLEVTAAFGLSFAVTTGRPVEPASTPRRVNGHAMARAAGLG